MLSIRLWYVIRALLSSGILRIFPPEERLEEWKKILSEQLSRTRTDDDKTRFFQLLREFHIERYGFEPTEEIDILPDEKPNQNLNSSEI